MRGHVHWNCLSRASSFKRVAWRRKDRIVGKYSSSPIFVKEKKIGRRKSGNPAEQKRDKRQIWVVKRKGRERADSSVSLIENTPDVSPPYQPINNLQIPEATVSALFRPSPCAPVSSSSPLLELSSTKNLESPMANLRVLPY